MSAQMAPRRIRSPEEQELVATTAAVANAREQLRIALAARDRLIVELLDSQARAADISEITGLSSQAVYAAAERHRRGE